ncbi:hypothetical protein SBA4_4750017 [Candidatus Sulfopaludibacter sp. SbA4]|nr:hypothetical protein SBA4_4750017 [Candidatus Sulfopaludibacter sp. SbA4]
MQALPAPDCGGSDPKGPPPRSPPHLVEEVKRIHIVVKDGNVALEGEVSSQADKERASALAKHVQNVRDVTNNLVIQK